MKDAKTELRKWYYELLQGITYKGDVVPVYANEVNDTVAPYTREEPPKRYIILSNQISNDASAKCNFTERHDIQVDSYTEYPAYNVSYTESEDINAIIKGRVLPNNGGGFDIPGFKVIMSRQTLSRNLSEPTKEKNIYRTITIFTHSITEK